MIDTSKLATYFHDSETQFGIFYPSHHLVAIFPSVAAALRAEQQLRDSGTSGYDCMVAGGDAVVQFAEDSLVKGGLWSLLMTQISRTIGTEARYADQDLELARQGAAFLAVHCINDAAKIDAWKTLESAHPSPLVARYYSLGGIEHLAGES